MLRKAQRTLVNSGTLSLILLRTWRTPLDRSFYAGGVPTSYGGLRRTQEADPHRGRQNKGLSSIIY